MIARNILRGMGEKGLSARNTASLLQVSEPIFWRWRTAKTLPGAGNLQNLADLLFDGDINQLYWPEDSAA